MASATEICNLALTHIGVGKEIQNLTTENSPEAAACRRVYETARDATLRDFDWPFATRIAELGLVEENPNDEWTYSYRYPTNSIKIRKILSGTRNDTSDSQVPYKIANDDAGLLLFTDEQNASIEYTYKVTDPLKYSPDFIMALSFRIAAYIAPRLTKGDPFKLGPRALQFYFAELSSAQASSVNEEKKERAPDSEFIRGRD